MSPNVAENCLLDHKGSGESIESRDHQTVGSPLLNHRQSLGKSGALCGRLGSGDAIVASDSNELVIMQIRVRADASSWTSRPRPSSAWRSVETSR